MYVLILTKHIAIVVSASIDMMVSKSETCQGWKIKRERKEKKKDIYQSHWTELINFYNIVSVTDQDEPNKIYLSFLESNRLESL
jgi:hypothetical protein